MNHVEVRAVLDEIIALSCSYDVTKSEMAFPLFWEIEKLARACAGRLKLTGIDPSVQATNENDPTTAAACSDEREAGSTVAGCNDSKTSTGGAGADTT